MRSVFVSDFLMLHSIEKKKAQSLKKNRKKTTILANWCLFCFVLFFSSLAFLKSLHVRTRHLGDGGKRLGALGRSENPLCINSARLPTAQPPKIKCYPAPSPISPFHKSPPAARPMNMAAPPPPPPAIARPRDFTSAVKKVCGERNDEYESSQAGEAVFVLTN
jgi:hypothetical protein